MPKQQYTAQEEFGRERKIPEGLRTSNNFSVFRTGRVLNLSTPPRLGEWPTYLET